MTTGAVTASSINATGAITTEGLLTADRITGGNSANNLHIDPEVASGKIYLNWYRGSSIVFGAANASTTTATMSSAGLTMNANLDGFLRAVTQNCNSAGCAASCPTGHKIMEARFFHGAYANARVNLSSWDCGAAQTWMGDCIGQVSCTGPTSGCGTSSMYLLCARQSSAQ